MAKDKSLSRAVLITLGKKLGDSYRQYVANLPLPLVGLAHRIEDAKGQEVRSISTPFDELKKSGEDAFDPLAIRILVEAFDKAWNDLQSLKNNPVSEERLARLLMVFLKEGERNPSRLATKAVLTLLASRQG